MKIFLQYPWKFPDSPYYKYLVESPPDEIEYLNVENQKGVITDKKTLWLLNFLKKLLRFFIKKLNIPLTNAHLTKTKEHFDLIHCAHCLSLNKKEKWVADFESLWQLYVGKKNNTTRNKIKNIFMSKNCKKIIVWTKNVKEDFEREFPEIKDKIEIVYPAIPFHKIRKKNHKGVNLLFVARSFYEKGGLDALRSIDLLTKKYNNTRGIVVSKVPEEVIKTYSENKKMEFFDLIEKRDLDEIYSKTDILIYPGYTDTFGFGVVECMSFGVPTISVSGFTGKDSKNELVINGENGFLINIPQNFNLGRVKFSFKEQTSLSEAEKRENPVIINEIIEKASKIIENSVLREKMSEKCIEAVKNGRFSIKERNIKLKKIYEEALKN